MYTLIVVALVALVLAVLWANAASMRRATSRPAKRPEPVPRLFPGKDPDMSYEMADELAVDPEATGKQHQPGGGPYDGTQV